MQSRPRLDHRFNVDLVNSVGESHLSVPPVSSVDSTFRKEALPFAEYFVGFDHAKKVPIGDITDDGIDMHRKTYQVLRTSNMLTQVHSPAEATFVVCAEEEATPPKSVACCLGPCVSSHKR